MNHSYTRVNPRYKERTFPLRVVLGCGRQICGDAVLPSAYGTTVNIKMGDFLYLRNNPELWNDNARLIVKTSLNEIPACVNSIKSENDRYTLSLRLLDDRTWID